MQPDLAKWYRGRAEECWGIAAERDPSQREIWLKMAGYWLLLAGRESVRGGASHDPVPLFPVASYLRWWEPVSGHSDLNTLPPLG